MLFVLPGFISGMQEALAPFVVLDEPDTPLQADPVLTSVNLATRLAKPC